MTTSRRRAVAVAVAVARWRGRGRAWRSRLAVAPRARTRTHQRARAREIKKETITRSLTTPHPRHLRRPSPSRASRVEIAIPKTLSVSLICPGKSTPVASSVIIPINIPIIVARPFKISFFGVHPNARASSAASSNCFSLKYFTMAFARSRWYSTVVGADARAMTRDARAPRGDVPATRGRERAAATRMTSRCGDDAVTSTRGFVGVDAY